MYRGEGQRPTSKILAVNQHTRGAYLPPHPPRQPKIAVPQATQTGGKNRTVIDINLNINISVNRSRDSIKTERAHPIQHWQSSKPPARPIQQPFLQALPVNIQCANRPIMTRQAHSSSVRLLPQSNLVSRIGNTVPRVRVGPGTGIKTERDQLGTFLTIDSAANIPVAIQEVNQAKETNFELPQNQVEIVEEVSALPVV